MLMLLLVGWCGCWWRRQILAILTKAIRCLDYWWVFDYRVRSFSLNWMEVVRVLVRPRLRFAQIVVASNHHCYHSSIDGGHTTTTITVGDSQCGPNGFLHWRRKFRMQSQGFPDRSYNLETIFGAISLTLNWKEEPNPPGTDTVRLRSKLSID